ncbi:hypothetical protein AB1Y20_018731 [Prymnesium parvum]|uniref:Uncharacterized protein n=1 Tax=Prymnesium parvum TaxID=97485 RepID=A0AB34JTB1_PRYPA
MAGASLVYFSFVLLGCANLVPWQTNLALADYYAARYGSNVMEFAFPAVSTSVLLLTCAVLVCFGARLSFELRIVACTVVMAAALMVVPLVDALLSLHVISEATGFWLTMIAVSLNAMCSASAQNALYALASLVGDTATQALQTGNGIVGLIAVLLRVATKLGLGFTPSVWLFSLVAAASLLFSLAGYKAVTTHDSIAATLGTHERRRSQLAVGEGGTLQQAMLEGGAPKRVSAAATLRLVWLEAGSVFLVFFVCLTCFPGLTTSIVSTTWGLGSWYPIVLIASYNVADFVGKSLPARVRLFGRSALPCCVLCHAFFVPIFLLLVQPQLLPSWLQGDLLPVLIVAALGLCTGYIGCMCLMLGAEQGRGAEESESVGMVTSFCLMLGLSAGSNLGLFISTL